MKVFTNHHRDINIFKAPKQILDLIYKYPDRFHQKCFLKPLFSDNLSMIEETEAEGIAETSLMDNIDKRFELIHKFLK